MSTAFLPDPLHPAVVHLPIALAVLLPLIAVGALVAIRRGTAARPTWLLAIAFFAALSASAWYATETGEETAERVEKVVRESIVEEHEEAAETFLNVSAGVFVIALGGLAAGTIGSAARLIATAGALALLVMGYRVGHSGGALVYEHGAASAYTLTPSPTSAPPPEDTHAHP